MSEVEALLIEPLFDERGNEVSWAEYLTLEIQEADRYLDSLELPKGSPVASPRTMLAQIAILGTPGLSDFHLRYYNYYGLKEKGVFEGVIGSMIHKGFIVNLSDAKVEEAVETSIKSWPPSEQASKQYGLGDKAYNQIPQLKDIYYARQIGSSPVCRLDKWFMGARRSKKSA